MWLVNSNKAKKCKINAIGDTPVLGPVHNYYKYPFSTKMIIGGVKSLTEIKETVLTGILFETK